MANALGRQGVDTDLLVTCDPTAPDRLGRGVLRVLNYYQDGDTAFRRTLAGGPGFTGTLENRLVNGESHLTIEKRTPLHLEVIALLQALAADRAAGAALPAAPPAPVTAGR